jgi:hypothetical protein
MRPFSDNGSPSLYYQDDTKPKFADEYTFHVHGDSPCREAEGGTACYLLTMPQGYGIRFAPSTVPGPSQRAPRLSGRRRGSHKAR